MASNTLAFYCGFLPLENCELFFREANLTKGKLLVKHVFAVEEIIQADEHHLNGFTSARQRRLRCASEGKRSFSFLCSFYRSCRMYSRLEAKYTKVVILN